MAKFDEEGRRIDGPAPATENTNLGTITYKTPDNSLEIVENNVRDIQDSGTYKEDGVLSIPAHNDRIVEKGPDELQKVSDDGEPLITIVDPEKILILKRIMEERRERIKASKKENSRGE